MIRPLVMLFSLVLLNSMVLRADPINNLWRIRDRTDGVDTVSNVKDDSLTLAKHTLSFEFLGLTKTIYSFDYDFRVRSWLNARVAFCTISEKRNATNDVVRRSERSYGMMISGLVGQSWCGEFGTGLVYNQISDRSFWTLFLGLRYQHPSGGFMFRYGFYPALSGEYHFRADPLVILISSGLSIGYSF